MRWCALPILVSATLIGVIALKASPNLDEVRHLPAGLFCLQASSFELYEVNPPLVKMIAALPVDIAGMESDWAHYSDVPGARTEWQVEEQEKETQLI